MTSALDHARQLLSKAEDDLYVVQCLAQDGKAPQWTIGFHAQQAVEKALKAVLSQAGVEFPRTHNLSLLVGLLAQHELGEPPHAQQLAELTPFGVAFRYDEVDDEICPTLRDIDLQTRAMGVVQ